MTAPVAVPALTTLGDAAQALRWLRTVPVPGTLRSDSRAVRPGDAFIAWPGHRRDGRLFVRDALSAGAAACLVESEGAQAFDFEPIGHPGRVAMLPGLKAAAGVIADGWFGRPSTTLDVVAVTGTNGKTSTACWLAEALAALGKPCGVVGTLGVGRPGALVETGLTTPDPVALHAAFAGFVEQGLVAAAIEASSIGLVEQRLAGTAIRVAVFTNFTQDHLDHHGSMAAYWAAKRGLFDWPGLAAAVVNIDDAQGAELAHELSGRSGLDLWTTSLRAGAPLARLHAEQLRHTESGLVFTLVEDAQRAGVQTPLIGEHNVANLLGVVAALRALRVPLADAAAVLPRLAPVPGRLQRVPAEDPAAPAVVVDYAHTPDALDKALGALRPLARARGGALWCLFGCGGDRDAVKRPAMGAIAARDADQVVLTSDNPRSENPAQILAQILVGICRQERVAVIEDRAEAIRHAVGSAAAADVVLLAGKGHEAYQEVAGVKRPFCDLAVAAAALQARSHGQGVRR